MAWYHYLILGTFLFTVGACVGSFLNVCIYRIPLDLSLTRPGSRCPKCFEKIRPWDNVPILSWLFLRGRCRRCNQTISARYVLVEILVGCLFLTVCFAELNGHSREMVERNPTLVAGRVMTEMVFLALMVTAWFIDHDSEYIPRKLTISGSLLGLILGTMSPEARWGDEEPLTAIQGLQSGLIGLVVGVGLAYLARVACRSFGKDRTPGFDNVGLLAMVGAFLGWKLLLGALFIGLAMFGVKTLLRRALAATQKLGEFAPSSFRLPSCADLSMASIVVVLVCSCLASRSG